MWTASNLPLKWSALSWRWVSRATFGSGVESIGVRTALHCSGAVVTTGNDRVASEVLNRVRSEFLEMPDLCLTTVQAERLLALRAEVCRAALETLVDDQFLSRSITGSYVQSSCR